MTKFISFLSFVFALIAFVAHVDGLKTSSFASFAGRLKSNGVRGRAGTFLHAKRRTKISKKKQGGGSASSSVSRTSIQNGGANSALPQDEVPAVVPEESVGVAANSNYVQTAPIVINKGKGVYRIQQRKKGEVMSGESCRMRKMAAPLGC